MIPNYNFVNNNDIVFISDKSFKQNKLVAKDIRKYINENINFKNIICIGGEAYLIGLTNFNVNKIINYTNSESIYKDADFNNKFYRKIEENKLIDYNNFNQIKNEDILIINLAKLNNNLMKVINKRFYKKIIIINCHHLDFWKKIKLLDNYKLIIRKKFITTINFITVNILIYKYEIPTFISLGGTCAIAHQLKECGLRNKSYPFDWGRMNFNKLNKVLETNFKYYNNVEFKKFSNNHLLNNDFNNGSFILKNDYNITFAHEIKKESKLELENFKKIIKRRIERFKKLNNKQIIFVILNTEKKNIDINILINNLKIYFTNFKIIYIGLNKLEQNNLIKFIQLKDEDWLDWQYSNLNWFDILF